MKIIIANKDENFIKTCKQLLINTCDYTFEFFVGDALELKADAIVSPANSFGYMNGGFDHQLSLYYGYDIGQIVRKRIISYFNGEMLIGQSDIIGPLEKDIKYLIVAPTMRVPMILDKNTVNPYLAMKSILKSIDKRFDSIILTGLGTGIGRVTAETFSNQVNCAIKDHVMEFFPINLSAALVRHQLLYGSDIKDLQH